jgi:hypothetical protein
VLVSAEAKTLGREADKPHQLSLVQVRGSRSTPTGALNSAHLSREQLRLKAQGAQLSIVRVGQRRLRVDGELTDQAMVHAGSTLEIESEALFYVEGPWQEVPAGLDAFPWGAPDTDGLIGESPAAWRHRRQLDDAGKRSDHLWIVGDRGSGRLRAARATHRRGAPSRLLMHDADRAAPGSTVIVPAAQSAAFLARDDIRALVIAEPETVPLRVPQRLDVPNLEQRRADIPLIARQILLEWTLTEARSLARHIDERGEPKLSIELVRYLLLTDFPDNERGLEDRLWESIETSPQSRLAPPAGPTNVRAALWEEDFESLDD